MEDREDMEVAREEATAATREAWWVRGGIRIRRPGRLRRWPGRLWRTGRIWRWPGRRLRRLLEDCLLKENTVLKNKLTTFPTIPIKNLDFRCFHYYVSVGSVDILNSV